MGADPEIDINLCCSILGGWPGDIWSHLYEDPDPSLSDQD